MIVGGSPTGRGVVAAANYEARKYGIHSAMPAAQARRLCPHAVFIRSRMSLYSEVSTQLRQIFHRYTPLVEPLSLDEAFLDVTGSGRLFGSGLDIAARLKSDIREELRLVASVGLAPNKFLAKLASDLSKPDGLIEVPAASIDEFLAPLPVARLWGVGAAAQNKLHAMGIYTIEQLRAESGERIGARLGNWGRHIWELAHGRDERQVVPDHEAKSISHETTFEVDIASGSVLRAWLLDLCEQVARRLRQHQLRARTVEIKVRYSDFTTVSRSRTFGGPTDQTRAIWQLGAELLAEQLNRRNEAVRLLGIGVSGLEVEGPVQVDLFGEPQDRQQARIDGVLDAISERFGKGTAVRGGGLRNR